MKSVFILTTAFVFALFSCGEAEKKKNDNKIESPDREETPKSEAPGETSPASTEMLKELESSPGYEGVMGGTGEGTTIGTGSGNSKSGAGSGTIGNGGKGINGGNNITVNEEGMD